MNLYIRGRNTKDGHHDSVILTTRILRSLQIGLKPRPRSLGRIRRFNILKDNWGRWKQHSRTLIGSFMARRKPCVLTLGQSRKKHRIPLQLSKKIAQGNLTASCKRLISWFLLDKGTELGHKIVPVRPPKF
ncbi:hypothetical protein TNCV_608861 [Trichonephila clavipes]|nr:hypothetical protein TNCV_608861 [Trichonephila clavipes]